MQISNNSLLNLFYRLPQNLLEIFRVKNLAWHALAIGLTVALVLSGADWAYLKNFHNSSLARWFFPAVILGFFVPILFPVVLLLVAAVRKSAVWFNAALAAAQAAFVGWLLSAVYKFFTGRPGPGEAGGTLALHDISHVFRFGFYRGGVFWGWPSSHTTVSFALAAAMIQLFPKNKWVKIIALVYALYVGIGVSLTIHWLSDFAAGIIFGCVAGVVVGRSFGRRQHQLAETASR